MDIKFVHAVTPFALIIYLNLQLPRILRLYYLFMYVLNQIDADDDIFVALQKHVVDDYQQQKVTAFDNSKISL